MQRTLWLRVHPGAYDAASSTLTRAAMRVLAAAKEAGEPAAEIEIADLRGHTNAFELIGPKSSQVIHGVMKLVSEDKRKEVKEVCTTSRHLIQKYSPRTIVLEQVFSVTIPWLCSSRDDNRFGGK